MNVWTLDGNAFPRNPDSYDVKYDNANAAYVPQAAGNLVRVQAPQLISGATLNLTWKNADRRTLNFVMKGMNQPAYGAMHKILFAGIQPSQIAQVYFDTPQKTMSQDIYTSKLGEGGTRNDLVISARMVDPWMRSESPIPLLTPSVANVKALFGGPIGNTLDGIPIWNGVGWNTSLAGSGAASPSISNLGTAGWSPVIKINGPFTTCSITQTYFDVDGTGAGCKFVWTGGALVSGSYVLFNTQTKRCYLIIGGAMNEVYTFYIATVANLIPFSFWPPMPPGNNVLAIVTTGYGANTSFDLTNNGTNSFFYW